MRKVFHVFLGRADDSREQFLTEAGLPATPYELRDALDAVRESESETPYMEYLGEGGWQSLRLKMEALTDLPSLYALNALAGKMALMNGRERRAFTGLVLMERRDAGGRISIPRLYDLACATDVCHVIEAFGDADVGRFFVENGFFSELSGLPEAALERLDYEKIGRERREAAGGVLLTEEYAYAERDGDIPERFKDLDLTPKEPDYAVLLEAGGGENGVLLKLPAAPETLAAMGMETAFRCLDCRIPALRDAIEKAGSVAEVNQAARFLEAVPEERLGTYKALLSVKGFGTLRDALNLYKETDGYALNAAIRSPDAAARREIRSLLSEADAERILPYVDLSGLGKRIMAERGQVLTKYGAFCRKDGEPLLEQPRTPEPERGGAEGKSQKHKKRNAPSR